MNCQGTYRGKDGYLYKVVLYIAEPSVVFECVLTGERTSAMGVNSPMFKEFEKTSEASI